MLLKFNELYTKYNLEIKGVIHIGAHYGQEVHLYKEVGASDIILFEPSPANFFILEQLHGEKCELYKLALGNENKKIKMNVEATNKGQSNSILKPKIHLSQYPHITFNSEIEVDMVKLDDFMTIYKAQSKNKNKKYNFINIDVQGYELEVFKGSKETLKNIDYIITEVNRDFLYEDCALVEEIDSFLNQFDFKRVETNWEGGTWGDALYINSQRAIC